MSGVIFSCCGGCVLRAKRNTRQIMCPRLCVFYTSNPWKVSATRCYLLNYSSYSSWKVQWVGYAILTQHDDLFTSFQHQGRLRCLAVTSLVIQMSHKHLTLEEHRHSCNPSLTSRTLTHLPLTVTHMLLCSLGLVSAPSDVSIIWLVGSDTGHHNVLCGTIIIFSNMMNYRDPL